VLSPLKNEILVMAVGRDKPGLVAGVTSMIAEAQGNIEDMDQVVLRDIFIMSLLVSLPGVIKKKKLENDLIEEGKNLGLRIQVYDRRALEVF
jgi:ACT domain-containing protein